MSDQDNAPRAPDKAKMPNIAGMSGMSGMPPTALPPMAADGTHETTELLATVAHELRSPLAVINGYASTLLRHEGRLRKEERRDYLTAIVEASNHLRRLIERVFELVDLENGAIRLYPIAVDLAEIARAALADARQSAPTRYTFALRLESAYDAQWLVRGDPRLLREALDNLLENAVKYSPDGGDITVTLRPVPALATTAGEARREAIELIVSDMGIGLDVDHIERIFERFHRVDNRLTREAGGMGLGLAICRSIVERHGGRIWAENNPTGGSAFHIRLPVNAGASGTTQTTQAVQG